MTRKDIFRHARNFIGGKGSVFEYHNDEKSKSIDIMTNSDTKFSKVDVSATIGLSEMDLGLKSNNKSLRVELICVGDKGDEVTCNILATTAFDIMDMKECYWGQIIPDVIREYDKKCKTEHVVLLSPAFWDDYKPLESEDMTVVWLLLVPITNEELRFIEANGVDAFEKVLAEQSSDITDRKRNPFV